MHVVKSLIDPQMRMECEADATIKCAIAALFTVFQIGLAYIWAAKHISIRKSRLYAGGRTLSDTNCTYKAASLLAFALQNVICVATFWTSSPWLLQIHDNYLIRFLGASFVWPATFLYFLSLRYLGSNYSPCYDSHLPYRIITSGPYRYIRHPMYHLSFEKIIFL